MADGGYTSEMCQQAMIEELRELFKGKTFSGQEDEKPLKIYKQFLPFATDDDDDTDTNRSAFPCIVVKLAEGEVEGPGVAQEVLMQLVICAYDKGVDRQGYVDVVNIKESIMQHFTAYPAFGTAFTVGYPRAWALQDDDTGPYYWGVVNLIISIPTNRMSSIEELI